MRKASILLIVLGLIVLFIPMGAFAGDYEWWNDDDGDGIPNCLDPDYVAPQDGTGYQYGHGTDDTFESVIGDNVIITGDPVPEGDGIPDQIRLKEKLQDGSCIE